MEVAVFGRGDVHEHVLDTCIVQLQQHYHQITILTIHELNSYLKLDSILATQQACCDLQLR